MKQVTHMIFLPLLVGSVLLSWLVGSIFASHLSLGDEMRTLSVLFGCSAALITFSVSTFTLLAASETADEERAKSGFRMKMAGAVLFVLMPIIGGFVFLDAGLDPNSDFDTSTKQNLLSLGISTLSGGIIGYVLTLIYYAIGVCGKRVS